jgi:poly(3-hydroxybutyrate) depolymerase
VAGVVREAAIRFPPGYDNTVPHAVVFELHGDQNLGTPLPARSFNRGLFDADEYDNRAVVVALRGINRLAPEVRDDFSTFASWDSLSPPARNNDVLAMRAFRALIDENACVDLTKVFAVGFSGGGFLAHSLRCFGEELRAIVVFEGGVEGLPAGTEFLRDDAGRFLRLDLATCSTRAAPVLVVHGRADRTVTLQQGEFGATQWARVNGCNPNLSSVIASALDPECNDFVGCGANPVSLCRPVGVGHVIWSPEGSTVVRRFFTPFFNEVRP